MLRAQYYLGVATVLLLMSLPLMRLAVATVLLLMSLPLMRLAVATKIDMSPTSLLKDFAHLVVGFALGIAAHARTCNPLTTPRHDNLFWVALAVSLFELVMAVAT